MAVSLHFFREEGLNLEYCNHHRIDNFLAKMPVLGPEVDHPNGARILRRLSRRLYGGEGEVCVLPGMDDPAAVRILRLQRPEWTHIPPVSKQGTGRPPQASITCGPASDRSSLSSRSQPLVANPSVSGPHLTLRRPFDRLRERLRVRGSIMFVELVERPAKRNLYGASVGQRASRRIVSAAVEDDHGASVRPPRLAGLQAAISLAMAIHLAAKVS